MCGGLGRNRTIDTRIFNPILSRNFSLTISAAILPRKAKYLMRITEIIKPPTADQARIKALSAAKKRAADALKAERERQKRAKGLEMLRGTYP